MVMNQINIACKKFILTEASERVDDFISKKHPSFRRRLPNKAQHFVLALSVVSITNKNFNDPKNDKPSAK